MNETPLQRLVDAVFPWLSRQSVSGLCWLLHAALGIGCVIGLWHINRAFGFDHWLHAPSPGLSRYWLPMLFVLVYLLALLTAGMWNALGPIEDAQAAPDLDATWDEARQFLDRTCFNAKELPLFLVLGALTTDLKSWLESIRATSVLPRAATPLHVYANDDAIFVICSSASLLGVYSSKGLAETNISAREVLGRLQHVCQMLERDRKPRCAMQGIVLAAPFQTLQADVATQRLILACQDDLRTIREATGLECPLHVVIAGVTGVPECGSEGWAQRFKLSTDFDADEMAAMFAERLDELFARTLPRLVRSKMQLDVAPVGASMTEVLRSNIQHFLFLSAASSWRHRLGRLVEEATAIDAEPGLVAGCYFLPPGSTGKPDAPVHRLLYEDLLSDQVFATRTPETVAQWRHEQRLTQQGYGLIVAGWVGMLLVAGWVAISH